MLWRRKSEGFDWHKYVPTTLLLRRRDRRRRMARAQQVAVEGLKDAGQAALEGVKGAGRAGLAAGSTGIAAAGPVAVALIRLGFSALRRLASVAGRTGVAGARRGSAALLRLIHRAVRLGLACMRLGFSGLRWLGFAFSRIVARATSKVLLPAWRVARHELLPLAAKIDRSGYVQSLLVFGFVILLIGIAHAWSTGPNANAIAAIGLALALLAVASLPYTVGERDWPWAEELRQALSRLNRRLPRLSRLPRPAPWALATGVALAALTGVGWLIAQHAGQIASIAWLPGSGGDTLKGRATALSGDTLRLGGRAIKLAGIDAPELDQQCGGRARGRTWRCGAAARSALQSLVRGRIVRCDASGTDTSARTVATCYLGDKDLGAELVRRGHVFADAGLFSGYGRLESTARSARLGLWRFSPVERPSEFRARLWEAAKRTAPEGCPIKGNVTPDGRVYVLPWSPDYARIRVREQRGERWFCSEQEALAAGWRPFHRS